jgi:DNA-binding CsgD family transcriptional regulator
VQRNGSQRSVFVGRHGELARLDDVLRRAIHGVGTAVVLSGEAGIGKSRLADEVARQGRDLGALVGWGRCYDQAGAPAFWPWVEAMRAVMAADHDDTITALTDDLGPEIATVFPDLADRIPPVSVLDVDPAEARFRQFTSTTTLLTRLSAIRPMIVVLDDVQWADRASLALLEFMAPRLTEMRVLLIVTARDDRRLREDPVSRTLATLGRAGGAVWSRLEGLAADDSYALVHEILGDAADPRLALELHRRTDGNPLFLVESARQLAAMEGNPADAPDVLPPTVTELIGRRFAVFSATETELLTLAAIVGREFSAAFLQVAANVPLDVALDVLESAERAGLIRAESRIGTFGFAHPLTREVLTADLTTTRRARLHRRVGEAIAAQHAADPEPVLSELAFHFSQSVSTGTGAVALEYATRAAMRAAQLHAFEEAVQNYDLALAVVTDRVQRCDLQLALGEVLNDSGDLDRAAAVFADAAAGARALLVDGAAPGAARQLGQAAVGMSMITVAIDQGAGRHGLIDDALRALGDDEPRLRVELLTRLAGSLNYTPEVGRRDALLGEALEVATALGSPEVICTVIAVQSLVVWDPDDLTARRRQSDTLADLAVAAGSRHFMMEACRLRITAMLDSGDIAGLDAALADHAALADEGFGVHSWRAAMWRTMRCLLDGRYADAEAAMAVAQDLARTVGHPDAFFWFAAQSLTLRWDQGRLAELEGSVVSLMDSAPAMPLWRSVLAATYAELGRFDEVRHHVERVVADLHSAQAEQTNPFTTLLPFAEGLPTAILLADAIVAVGDSDRGRQLYDVLAPYAGHAVMAGPAVAFLGCVDHRLATLSALTGDESASEHHFDRALLRYERMGSRPWLARLYCDRARTLASHRAAVMLDEAARIATELGMPGVLRRSTDAATHRLPVSDHPGRVAVDVTPADRQRFESLTEREHHVVRLMAAGRTNPQIARELTIATKTVMHHAASIYRKLDVNGRTEAAAFIARVEHRA